MEFARIEHDFVSLLPGCFQGRRVASSHTSPPFTNVSVHSKFPCVMHDAAISMSPVPMQEACFLPCAAHPTSGSRTACRSDWDYAEQQGCRHVVPHQTFLLCCPTPSFDGHSNEVSETGCLTFASLLFRLFPSVIPAD
jgi:hypothetical protein